MAEIVNTVRTYDRKGIREDLSDYIYDITPDETPFLTSAGRGTVENTFAQWQNDELAAPNTGNAVPQGDDVTIFDEAPPTEMIGNHTQISRKTLIVAETADVVKKAGRKSELAYQLAKKARELKLDMEAILLSNQGATPGSNGVAGTTASVLAFIKTNVDHDASGANPVYTTVPTAGRTDGTQRPFTEDILKNVLQMCWSSGAKVKEVLVGPHNKTVASGFGGIAEKVHNVSGRAKPTIVASADVYVSDFGTVTIVPHRYMRPRDAIFLDYEYVSVDYLRPFKTVKLARTGDAEKRMLIVEYMLRVKNERALGLAADLTTAA